MKYYFNGLFYLVGSKYSDWLRPALPRGQSSIPLGVKNVLFSISSLPALAPTKPPIQ
jgi:hypothetical protein